MSMRNEDKTKEQLIGELVELRRRNTELEESEFKRTRTEKALRQSERRYRALVETVTDIIFTVDGDWNFTFLSPKIEEITGYYVQDLIWHPLVEILAPEYTEAALDCFRRESFDRTSFLYEVAFIHRDGKRIPVELSIIPILDAKGQPTGVILGTVRNLTERKQTEEHLLNAQKLESIGTLAGGIAHDFNNILTGVMGNISLAKIYVETGNAADKVIEKLTVAEKAILRARDSTQQLLTFSRGGAPVKKIASIGSLLKDSADFALSGSNVRCELSISDDLWPVEVDEGQIGQAINNLIINADQAMPEGGVIKMHAENVTVGTEDALPLEEGVFVKVSIEDQGIGIPEEHLQKIFDPYFTTRQGSSGLGLTTSFSIIQKHNGHITVESQLEVGTIFHIYLPASPEGALVKEEKEEGKSIMREGSILVMDDEEVIRELLADVLTISGYKVVTAIDGAEAIERYKETMESGKHFDAVILDLTIPGGMGGKEAIQKLMETDPEVKAIVSSGYSYDPIMSDFGEYGFKGVVAKPYKIEELSRVLQEVINGATSREPVTLQQPNVPNVAAPEGDYEYVASKSSEVFHTLLCTWAETLAEGNRVYFRTFKDAMDSERRPCSMCKPGDFEE